MPQHATITYIHVKQGNLYSQQRERTAMQCIRYCDNELKFKPIDIT